MTAFLVIVDSVPKRIFMTREAAASFASRFGVGAAILPIPCEVD